MGDPEVAVRSIEVRRHRLVRMHFDRFVRSIMAPPDGNEGLYLTIQTARALLSPPLLQLLRDFTLPVYFRQSPIRWIHLWMGNSARPMRSRLHHDYHDNLYVVVSGTKSFTAFPPEDAYNLSTVGREAALHSNGLIRYRSRRGDRDPNFSRLDLEDVDPVAFPRFRDANRSDFT